MPVIDFIFFFFFSSRRRHTRWPRDWSSDVCSSDLLIVAAIPVRGEPHGVAVGAGAVWVADANGAILKVNPNTNEIVARIPVDGVPSGLAFGFGRLWIALD